MLTGRGGDCKAGDFSLFLAAAIGYKATRRAAGVGAAKMGYREMVMDRVDWGVFFAALAGIPLSIWFLVRWWRQYRKNGQRRDWQSLVMFVLGLVCMVAIVIHYLLRYILPNNA